MFNTYQATIHHAGKIFHQMVKKDLSAAEIVVLKAVHGPQGVVDIIETEGKKMFFYTNATEDGAFKTLFRPATLQDEKTFLEEKYGTKKFQEVFPGFAPALPTDLAQVGIQYTALPPSTVEQMKPLAAQESADAAGEDQSSAPRLPKHLRG